VSTFTISELAQRAGLNPKTIRYYEEIGPLPRPARNCASKLVLTPYIAPSAQRDHRARPHPARKTAGPPICRAAATPGETTRGMGIHSR